MFTLAACLLGRTLAQARLCVPAYEILFFLYFGKVYFSDGIFLFVLDNSLTNQYFRNCVIATRFIVYISFDRGLCGLHMSRPTPGTYYSCLSDFIQMICVTSVHSCVPECLKYVYACVRARVYVCVFARTFVSSHVGLFVSFAHIIVPECCVTVCKTAIPRISVSLKLDS